jgi:hypothetical protein
MAACTPLTVVFRSSTNAEIDTFIIVVSMTMMNMASESVINAPHFFTTESS